MARRQHHQTHDAFPIHLLTIFLDVDVRLEAVGRLYKLSRRPRVDAQLIENGEILFGHGLGLTPANLRKGKPIIQGKNWS